MNRAPLHSAHRDFSPAGFPRDGRPTVLALTTQFHAPVHFPAIRGLYGFTNQLEAPAIYWGRNGRCFAFLHDLTPEALARVMADCRAAAHDRRQPWGLHDEPLSKDRSPHMVRREIPGAFAGRAQRARLVVLPADRPPYWPDSRPLQSGAGRNG